MRMEERAAYSMILPAMLLVAALGIYPLLETVKLGFYDFSLLSGDKNFVGLKNYQAILSDPLFRQSVKQTVYFMVCSIGLQMILGVGAAMLLNQEFRGRGFVRALVFLPWAVPTIVNANTWNWIYHASYGALNRLLLKMGLIDGPVIWLGKTDTALNMIILADTWRVLPLYIVLLLAALQTVDPVLIEAAKIDGANSWNRFRNVHLPTLQPTMIVLLVMRTIQTFRVFDIIYVMTQGGPNNGTMVVSFYGYYQSFKYLNWGYGSAVSIVISLTVLLLSIVFLRIISRDD
ncbi:MAG: sugar ABC transporter permease [Dorea sp.]|nr:sugar ABC transporter permease [Dorea sp.]